MERNIIQEKRDHLKLFFNFILSEADLNTCGIKPLEENQANVGLKVKASVAKEEWNSILHREQQTTESLLSNDKNFPEWKKVPIVTSDLDINNVPKTTISAIFSEAESLLNEKYKTSVHPLIVAPTSRKTF